MQFGRCSGEEANLARQGVGGVRGGRGLGRGGAAGGAIVGAPVALLGERIFLRPLSIAELLEAWPTLLCIVSASAAASTFWLLFLAWAVNPIVFLAGCAGIRWRWERSRGQP
jgi:hypothetical protein